MARPKMTPPIVALLILVLASGCTIAPASVYSTSCMSTLPSPIQLNQVVQFSMPVCTVSGCTYDYTQFSITIQNDDWYHGANAYKVYVWNPQQGYIYISTTSSTAPGEANTLAYQYVGWETGNPISFLINPVYSYQDCPFTVTSLVLWRFYSCTVPDTTTATTTTTTWPTTSTTTSGTTTTTTTTATTTTTTVTTVTTVGWASINVRATAMGGVPIANLNIMVYQDSGVLAYRSQTTNGQGMAGFSVEPGHTYTAKASLNSVERSQGPTTLSSGGSWNPQLTWPDVTPPTTAPTVIWTGTGTPPPTVSTTATIDAGQFETITTDSVLVMAAFLVGALILVAVVGRRL